MSLNAFHATEENKQILGHILSLKKCERARALVCVYVRVWWWWVCVYGGGGEGGGG